MHIAVSRNFVAGSGVSIADDSDATVVLFLYSLLEFFYCNSRHIVIYIVSLYIILHILTFVFFF